jgi:hypothetical protein
MPKLLVSIDLNLSQVTPAETEKIVDEDINEFNEFFRSLGNDSIVRGEKAIIKTYLAWKLGLTKRSPDSGDPKAPASDVTNEP